MTLISMAVVMLFTSVAAAGPGAGQEHAGCPMAAAATHRADVDRRHDEVSGTTHDSVVHHFVLARDGGSIHLEMADASDPEGRDRIRMHLRMVAHAFALGDFTMPMLVHDRTPPGVDVMKGRRDRIRYRFSATDKGGVVRISTRDAEALAAVHAFLRFQIQDHATDDPTD